MAELAPFARRSQWHFDWVLPLLFKPRQTLHTIAQAADGVWQTPIWLIAGTTLLRVLVTGSIQAASAATGQVTLPPGFEYYTAEQQAQFMQAATATSGPVFVYVLPAVLGIAAVFLGWLILGWALHLVLTLFGGRNSNQQVLNITAWAMLPFALRDVVRTLAMTNSGQILTGLGLSGLMTADGELLTAYIASFLSQIDIYLLWEILLLFLGARLISTLTRPKTWLAVTFTVFLLLLLRALPAILGAMLGDLTVVRPFF